MTREELQRELSDLARTAESEQTRVSAANALAKLAYDTSETPVPSPAEVIEWLSAHEGECKRFKPGLVALMAWCKAGLDDLRAAVAEIESEIVATSAEKHTTDSVPAEDMTHDIPLDAQEP